MTPTEHVSYYAVRTSPRAAAPDWWSAAVRRRDIPPGITPLLRGRNRVELTHEEATHALAWAGTIAGWPAAGPKPLYIHHPALDAA